MKAFFTKSILFIGAFILLGSLASQAQYGNEWIDFSKSYWKFQVSKEGIFRITKSQLDAAGVPTTANGSDFVVFRDGKEVTLFTSSNGSFSGSDFIEFYGKANNGVLDKELYLAADKYTNEYTSLFSDTAAYFLTIDNTVTHKRYIQISNPIPPTPPAAATYCWATVGNNASRFSGNFMPGKTNGPPDATSSSITPLYASQFDLGEGYKMAGAASVATLNLSIPTPNFVSGTMNARLKTASIGVSKNTPHNLKLLFNGSEKTNVSYGISDIKHLDLSIPSSELIATNTLGFSHYSTGAVDEFGVPYWQIEYPRNWDFNGLDFFTFKLEANASNQYVEINNFNHGGIAPKLYDQTNNKYYTGEISVVGKTRFYIDPSLTAMEMILFANASSKVGFTTYAKMVTFTNYNSSANQGDYIIISHKRLMQPYAGKNQIDEYKNYRSSAAGGSHKVVVADIDELYNQFAFGTYIHPLSITHFIDFAIARWSSKPKDVFLIGKGVSYERFSNYTASGIYNYVEGFVPTYGSPGSDNAFVTDKSTWKSKTNIGRLSAITRAEVANYLNKVKGYEAAILPAAFPTPSTESWKKQILHIAGGDGGVPPLQAGTLIPTLNNGKNIITAPMSGASVTTIAKATIGFPTTAGDKSIDSLISNGLSMITYYGHGSASTLDYNIKEPNEFVTLPKIPIFTALGCEISEIYRIDTLKTITERFISAPLSGSVVSVASNNTGYTSIHTPYLPVLYTQIASAKYGKTIGEQYTAAQDSFMNRGGEIPFQTSFAQTHMESLIFQGDPALASTFSATKHDYFVGNDYLSTTPSDVTIALDSFKLNISSYNLGQINYDSVQIKVEHTNPEGKTTTAKTVLITNHEHLNKSEIWIPIDKTKDLGKNTYKITIDPTNKYDEISEANNLATIEVIILSDNIVPVYPYNFSIVYNSDLTLKASTLNPFKGLGRYKIEIDTTELFNSPSKVATSIDSRGGIIKWKPSIMMQDSMVYYWRTSLDSAVNGSYTWASSSFIYLKNGSAGWNQSHYYQYKYNSLDSLNYPENRKFSYGKSRVELRVLNTIMELQSPYTYYGDADFNRVFYNGIDFQRLDCNLIGGLIQIMVFDSSSGKGWENPPFGKQGSNTQCGRFARNINCFSFNLSNATGRNNARKFLDSIPNGNYVLVKNCIDYLYFPNAYVDTWQNDTLTYGSGKSLYHSMRNLGFNQIDSFYQLRAFSMICKKGYSDYPVQQNFAVGVNDVLDTTYYIPITDIKGKMNSIVVGPASKWKTMKWRTSSYFDTSSLADSSSVIITGIDPSNTESMLYQGSTRDTNLNFIDAAAFPKLKLQWFSMDSQFHTTPQLDYWRILYDPLPEAALNPSAYYSFTDSVSVGQMMNLQTAIETITDLPMDSMLVRYKVIDANGINHLLADKKYRKLNGNDTLHASIDFDPAAYPGKNFLFIEANPDNNQPEQYHPNNLGYIPFDIKTDKFNPVLDVTFDGVHILDKDIVSSKPFIKVLLRDENKFLAVKDTNSIALFLRYPGEPQNTRNRIPFDGSMCKFIAADISSNKNEASIEFRPTFLQDGIYQLYTKGKDAMGNEAGTGAEYSVSFEVVNRSTITNLLNYPNPFSTSTAFVFTLTGSQIPSQFKIQILSVTGKVVREITKQELGPLHIGRNITEYKWDGKDQFGQMLGNGVYLYRVVTTINGENIERRANADVDKFYKKGYSKMYIMR